MVHLSSSKWTTTTTATTTINVTMGWCHSNFIALSHQFLKIFFLMIVKFSKIFVMFAPYIRERCLPIKIVMIVIRDEHRTNARYDGTDKN